MSDKSTQIVLQRVQAAKLSRDFAMATRLLRQALDADPCDAALWKELGTCYVKSGNDRRAIEPFNEVLKLVPNDIDALNELGGIYRRVGEFDRSIAVLEKGLMTSPDTVQINYNLGHTYKMAGRYDAAEECFNQVLERNPLDVLTINHLGCIQALRGNHAEALLSFRKALQIDPNHPILHLNSARSYQALGKEAEAKTAYENALKSKPGWEEAMNGYAELLMHSKDLNKCDSILEQAIKINPTSPELHSSKGHLNVKQGRYLDAETSYNTALDYDDENMNALNGVEQLYERQGRSGDALKKIQRMVELSPDNLDYELRYSKLLIDQKRLEEAGEKLKSLYKANLDNTAYLNMLAQYFIRSGHVDKANGCFQRISELEPGNFTYLRDAARQFLQNQQFEEAAEHLDRYLQKKPSDPVALGLRGDVYEQHNDPENALLSWKKALEYDENNPVILASVQRVGNQNSEQLEITALMTDILSDSARNGDAESIKKSLEMYENSFQNEDIEEDTVVPEPIIEDLSEDIASIEQIDYDQLLQFEPEPDDIETDPYDTLTLDVPPAEYLRPIDEEMYRKDLQNELTDHQLIDDDMPLEYDQSRDGAFDFDPFMEGNSQQYAPDETDSLLDVQGTGFEEEFIDDTENEDTVYQSVGEPVPAPPARPAVERPRAEPQSQPEPQQNAEPVTEPVPAAESVPDSFEPDMEPEMEPELEPDLNDDILFPGDRDTSEDEIPTVDDLISEPVEEDDLHELTDVPTISDLIGDDLMSEPELEEESSEIELPEEPVFEEEPAVEEEPPVSEPDYEDFMSDHPDPETRTVETVSNVLQNVVFKSEERPDFASAAAMFSDLRDLTQWLPEDKHTAFMHSLDRLKLDYVIARLKGKPGLLSAATAVRETGGIIPEPPKTTPSLLKTMEYLRNLAGQVPDASQAEAMTEQMDQVVGLLKKAGR